MAQSVLPVTWRSGVTRNCNCLYMSHASYESYERLPALGRNRTDRTYGTYMAPSLLPVTPRSEVTRNCNWRCVACWACWLHVSWRWRIGRKVLRAV